MSEKAVALSPIRDAVHQLADSLPDDSTWEDVMEEVYVRLVVAEGLKAAEEGRTYSTEEVRRRLGLPT